jgi:hypothetical protein
MHKTKTQKKEKRNPPEPRRSKPQITHLGTTRIIAAGAMVLPFFSCSSELPWLQNATRKARLLYKILDRMGQIGRLFPLPREQRAAKRQNSVQPLSITSSSIVVHSWPHSVDLISTARFEQLTLILKIDARIRIQESSASALTHVQSDLRVATGSRKSLRPHWKFLARALSMCTWPLQQLAKNFFLF